MFSFLTPAHQAPRWWQALIDLRSRKSLKLLTFSLAVLLAACDAAPPPPTEAAELTKEKTEYSVILHRNESKFVEFYDTLNQTALAQAKQAVAVYPQDFEVKDGILYLNVYLHNKSSKRLSGILLNAIVGLEGAIQSATARTDDGDFYVTMPISYDGSTRLDLGKAGERHWVNPQEWVELKLAYKLSDLTTTYTQLSESEGIRRVFTPKSVRILIHRLNFTDGEVLDTFARAESGLPTIHTTDAEYAALKAGIDPRTGLVLSPDALAQAQTPAASVPAVSSAPARQAGTQNPGTQFAPETQIAVNPATPTPNPATTPVVTTQPAQPTQPGQAVADQGQVQTQVQGQVQGQQGQQVQQGQAQTKSKPPVFVGQDSQPEPTTAGQEPTVPGQQGLTGQAGQAQVNSDGTPVVPGTEAATPTLAQAPVELAPVEPVRTTVLRPTFTGERALLPIGQASNDAQALERQRLDAACYPSEEQANEPRQFLNQAAACEVIAKEDYAQIRNELAQLIDQLSEMTKQHRLYLLSLQEREENRVRQLKQPSN